MKYCINCGTKIIPNSNYCGECGKKLIFSTDKEIKDESNNKALLIESESTDNANVNNSFENIIVEEEDSSKNENLDRSDLEDITDKNKKSSFVEFIRFVFVAICFFLLSISINTLIGYIFFPAYIGNELFTGAIIMLLAGVIIRYLTLLRFNNKQRIISVLKNISIVSLITSVQGYLLPVGVLLICVFLILIIILDRLSENSYTEKIFGKKETITILERFTLVLLLIAIVFSMSAGRYNLKMDNVLEIIKSEESKKTRINDEDLSSADQLNNSSDNTTNLENTKEERISMDIYDMSINDSPALKRSIVRALVSEYGKDAIKEMINTHNHYFGSDENKKTTIARMQSKLKELGYYNGYVDGIDGQMTYEAIVKYKRDIYVDNEQQTIDEYANKSITLSLLKELEIKEP